MGNACIALIFLEYETLDEIMDTLLEAIAKAARPYSLRFALPAGTEEVLHLLPAEALQGNAAYSSIFFYPERGGLQGVGTLLTVETHFLSLRGGYRFEERWDRSLLQRYVRLPERALLTGLVSSMEEDFAPQPYMPAFTQAYSNNAVALGRGLPLVCPEGPVPTLAIWPGLLFGRVAFLREAETKGHFLSIAAFVAAVPVYALESPLLWPVRFPRRYWLVRPGADVLPPSHLLRFEQMAGFSFDKRHTGVRATLGMFFGEESYPQRMSGKLHQEQWMRRLRLVLKKGGRGAPFCVTAFVDLAERLKETAQYVARFAFLRKLQNLALLLYTGGSQERTLKMNYPNTLSYPDNALLPRSLLFEGMPAMELFKRNKLLLLQRTMKAYPGFSHYAWVDFDILPHPVCPQATPVFSHLMDDRVHLAMVDGEPDTSLMVAPYRSLKLLCREVYALSQVDVAIKRSFTEKAMMKRLIQKYPDMFALHPMPSRQLLFLTCLHPQLLSQEYQPLLEALPPVTIPMHTFGALGNKAKPKEGT